METRAEKPVVMDLFSVDTGKIVQRSAAVKWLSYNAGKGWREKIIADLRPVRRHAVQKWLPCFILSKSGGQTDTTWLLPARVSIFAESLISFSIDQEVQLLLGRFRFKRFNACIGPIAMLLNGSNLKFRLQDRARPRDGSQIC